MCQIETVYALERMKKAVIEEMRKDWVGLDHIRELLDSAAQKAYRDTFGVNAGSLGDILAGSDLDGRKLAEAAE